MIEKINPRDYRPAPDTMALTVDLLGRKPFTIAFPIADLDAHVEEITRAFDGDENIPPARGTMDKKRFLDCVILSVYEMLAQPIDQELMVKCGETVLWVVMTEDEKGNVRKVLANAVIEYGYAHMTIASDKVGRIAYAVGDGYVPLRGFPQVFVDGAFSMNGGVPEHVVS